MRTANEPLPDGNILLRDILFTCEYDFYLDILNWGTGDDSLSDVIVEEAWKLFRDDADPDLYRLCERFAGDVVLTSIELDGPYVKVTIYSEELAYSPKELAELKASNTKGDSDDILHE